MIEIAKETLDQSIGLLEITRICPNSVNCLWQKRSDLFQTPEFLPKNCPREDCQLIIFRKTFESESPGFYATALKFSQFDDVAKTTSTMALKIKKGGKMGGKRKKRKKRKEFRNVDNQVNNLRTFGELSVLAIYPLFLNAKKIPLLSFVEIKKFQTDYLNEAEIRQTIKKMGKMNREWLEWIEAISENIVSTNALNEVSDKEYSLRAILCLIYLFFRGIEKDQLPDVINMSPNKKDEFFSEIEKNIFKK